MLPGVTTGREQPCHGNVWKTRLLGDTVVFFAGPAAYSFFMDRGNFSRQRGTPKAIQKLLHPDAVPYLDGDRHLIRKRLLMSAFADDALEGYLPAVFTIFGPTSGTSSRDVGVESHHPGGRRRLPSATSPVTIQGSGRRGEGERILEPPQPLLRCHGTPRAALCGRQAVPAAHP